MYKEKLIGDLKRFLKYIVDTRVYSGIPCGGHKPEEYIKYPVGTPGISPYWDYEEHEMQFTELLIEWFETGVLNKRSLIGEKTIKIRLNTLYNLMLEQNIDKYDSLFIANVYRGVDILLALQVKKNWKKVYCTCLGETYEKLVKGFFVDQNISFQNIRLCVMSPTVFSENNILMICNGEAAHGIATYINNPKITRIIKEGKVVDQTQPWENHNWLDTFDQDFISLQKSVNQRYG